ncbi:centrosomal protein of 128 kDa-like [Chenopodium quinoa]|uniref:centrosomal protein of 128 kDa-like n=1 Tax=Chenopodium quinoa TaxID=63459 RepID=UPI000B780BE0|nr:centrosomal protein of 128 kDa-like [Chenopodium quinoa]
MEEYLQYMKTLRTQMNDVEDQAAKISVEEQMQITTIHNLEKDLKSAKSETKRVVEETDQLVKSKAEICSKILEMQKRITSLESDSFNLSQTLELTRQEKSNFTAKVLEKRAYYAKVAEDMNSKLQEQKDWLDNKRRNEPYEDSSMQIDMPQEKSSKGPVPCSSGDEDKMLFRGKLHAAQSQLDEVISAKTKLVSDNSELKQTIEQLKSEINNLKPELSATEVITLEEEHKALLSEKNGEMEYMQSLQIQLEKLRGITCYQVCMRRGIQGGSGPL